MILGLTGSVGSGKSLVSSILRDLGAQVICADELAREVVAKGSPALQEIHREFGPGVLLPDGSLDRRALAARVFADAKARRTLEEIVHPRVRARELELLAQHAGEPIIVLDIPLLFETGAEELCDAVAVVVVDEDTRRARLTSNRGMSPAEIESRLAAQMPQAEKARRADHLIDNSGSREQTRAQVAALFRSLTAQK